MDMFEPQDHPDDIPYPGATPTPPYDSAGWTLALQMGVQFDRILDGFDGPFEKLTGLREAAGRRRFAARRTPPATTSSHKSNDSFIAINRLLAANEDVHVARQRPDGLRHVLRRRTSRRPAPILQKAATDLGVSFDAHGDRADRADGQAAQAAHRPVRHLRRRHAGRAGRDCCSRTSKFPYRRCVYPPMLDAGNLAAKYDVLIFNDEPLGAGWRRWPRRWWRRRCGGDAPATRRLAADAARRRGAPAAGRGGWPAVGGGRGGGRRRRARRATIRDRRRSSTSPRSSRSAAATSTPATLATDQAVRAGGRHGHRDRQRGATARCSCSSCRSSITW